MEYHINESEYRFLDILWDHEPVHSMELVRLCQEGLGWKKSTTYTVIRNLSDKQIVCNKDAIVRALVSRDEIQKRESKEFLEKKFRGSLPAFIAAFLKEERLSREEAEDLQKLIDRAVGEE